MLNSLLKDYLGSVCALLYPLICLHCEDELENGLTIFCRSCLESLEEINAKERCLRCFSADISDSKRICELCLKKPSLFTRVLSAYDLAGPAASLQKKLQTKSFLAEAAALLMANYLLKTALPLPDIIVPIGQTFSERLEGFYPSLIMAKQLSKILNRPLLSCLTYNPFRINLNSEGEASFHLKNLNLVEERSILLVSDLFASRGRMQECAEALSEGFPKSIYGLTLCRTL